MSVILCSESLETIIRNGSCVHVYTPAGVVIYESNSYFGPFCRDDPMLNVDRNNHLSIEKRKVSILRKGSSSR